MVLPMTPLAVLKAARGVDKERLTPRLLRARVVSWTPLAVLWLPVVLLSERKRLTPLAVLLESPVVLLKSAGTMRVACPDWAVLAVL